MEVNEAFQALKYDFKEGKIKKLHPQESRKIEIPRGVPAEKGAPTC